jgi:hypothetical protein
MRNRRIMYGYWLMTGGLIGFGVIGILSIGLPFLLLGLLLLIAGLAFWRGKGFWLALIGLGVLPAAILVFDIVTAPPPCPAGPIRLPPGAHSYICSGPLNQYYPLIAIFAAIALVGAAWPLFRWRLQARQRAQQIAGAQEDNTTRTLWIGLAAGILGFFTLAYVLFGPTGRYGSSGEQCTSSPGGGIVCTRLPTESGTTTMSFEPGSVAPYILLSLLAFILLSIIASTLLYSCSRNSLWKLVLRVSTGLLFILAFLSGASIGLCFLPSALVALCASIAAGSDAPANTQSTTRNNL